MKKILVVVVVLIMASACEEETPMPRGFEHMGQQGKFHFVYVHKEFLGDKTAQRHAGAAICRRFKTPDDCEIYYWKDKDQVVTSLPVRKNPMVAIGIYTLTKGKVKLKTLK